MNKNKELVDVKINENGLIDEVIEVKDIKYLPVGIDNDKDIKAQLNKWWHNRSIPASRDGLNYILHTYDVETPQALSAKSLGLSLSDQYWLKPVGNTIEWKDVNFFTNLICSCWEDLKGTTFCGSPISEFNASDQRLVPLSKIGAGPTNSNVFTSLINPKFP
jgi:hypothetical protein